MDTKRSSGHLSQYIKSLYELRFSPMCKPAAEVAGVTQLESHTTRSRIMTMWRVASGNASWSPRAVELVYQSTLDSISEAFDLAHYPVSEYMLAARADLWELGIAPDKVQQAVVKGSAFIEPDNPRASETLLLAGEISQLGDTSLLASILSALQAQGIEATPWIAPSGALAYALGARDLALDQAKRVVAALRSGGTTTVITDGPETAWALRKIYPSLGISLPLDLTVRLLPEVLLSRPAHSTGNLGSVFVHDSRPASLIADRMANNLAILPGYLDHEDSFGVGTVYEAPRRVLDQMGASRVFGRWTRSLAKSCGADDGLWLTYPSLAGELARQRLNEADRLGADLIVTDSPLAASFLRENAVGARVVVRFLPELIIERRNP
jgi:Fe-S oxidoreductase